MMFCKRFATGILVILLALSFGTSAIAQDKVSNTADKNPVLSLLEWLRGLQEMELKFPESLEPSLGDAVAEPAQSSSQNRFALSNLIEPEELNEFVSKWTREVQRGDEVNTASIETWLKQAAERVNNLFNKLNLRNSVE